MTFENLLRLRPYSASMLQRHEMLLPGLNELASHHYENCPEYSRIIDGLWDGCTNSESFEAMPYIPVSLFKTMTLRSTAPENIKLKLTSSGTTGQAVSQIQLDSETSLRQQTALANSLTFVLGPKRIPMLVLDSQDVYRNPAMMSARGAGVLGMMRYGRDHAFALRPDLTVDIDTVKDFLKKVGNQPFFMFGFTYLVWNKFYDEVKTEGFDFSNATLVHSGGWKKMIERAVDNAVFRSGFQTAFGLSKVFNFYGMVEQIGSIFLEGPGGYLYAPNFSNVIVRDPITWRPVANGTPGIVQVQSLLPRSYPGHSLLTEDLGVIENVDAGIDEWNGPSLRILGRIAKSELRGCSDVVASQAA